jgi:hypothetical protein
MPPLMPSGTLESGMPLISSDRCACFTLCGWLPNEPRKSWQSPQRRRSKRTVFLLTPVSDLTGAIDKPASRKVVGFEVIGSVGEFVVNNLCFTDCLGQIGICLELNW